MNQKIFGIAAITLLFFLSGCGNREGRDDNLFQIASENALQANEGFVRCDRYLSAWMNHADTSTGLIPRNLYESKDIWNAKDAAADNYPFMVLTASFTNKDLYHGKLTEMLDTEVNIAQRLGVLPDTYSFSGNDFRDEVVDTGSILFGASEYIKDGLLPLTEWLGQSPWSKHMINLMENVWQYANVPTDYGNVPTNNVEVHGEMLQALPRLYYMTGNENYLEWAIRLGNHYLKGAGYSKLYEDNLRLRDHGCEIVSGLCELYSIVSFERQELQKQYRQPLYSLLDSILEYGRNEDGLFYNVVNLRRGEVVDSGIADTWGYTYNGYYSIYLIDQVEAYRRAVLKALQNLDHYKNYDWERGSADGYADAIESALNLYNREKVASVGGWIDSQTRVMWSMQDSAHRENAAMWKNSGIIEGWHGDGNFARTTIMYCLWKTQGISVRPWKPSIFYGAVADSNAVFISLKSENDWSGHLFFDRKRHQDILHLPIDYPRINQFPEWFTLEDNPRYRVTRLNEGSTEEFSGKVLLDEGLAVDIKDGDWHKYKVELMR